MAFRTPQRKRCGRVFVTTSTHIPFPFDFTELLEPGGLETLSTLEVGVVWRLLRTAWMRRGSLPGDERTLAAVAGVDLQTWAALAPRVLWCLGWNGAMCAHAARAIETLERRQSDLRAVKAAAGKAGATRRWGPSAEDSKEATRGPRGLPMAGDSTCHARAMHVLSGAIPEQPRPVFEAPTYRVRAQRSALERTDLDMNQERSSAQSCQNPNRQNPNGQNPNEQDAVGVVEVVGAIHAGLDATVQARLTEWRRQRSREMLEAAARRWLAEGRIQAKGGRDKQDIDLAFVIRIAGHPNVTPALMQIAIQRADECRAASCLGYVCNALGASRGGKPLDPYLSDQAVLDRWKQLEDKQVSAEKAKAAVSNVVARVQPVTEDTQAYAARRGELANLKAGMKQRAAQGRA